jgi:hypothetical protein
MNGRRKRGRPAKPGARKPSGDLKFVPDKGSVELLAQRVIALQPELGIRWVGQGTERHEVLTRADVLATYRAAKDRRGSYILGVLFAQRKITREQHWAGMRYRALYGSIFGLGTVKSAIADLSGAMKSRPVSQAEDQRGIDRWESFERARSVLERRGRHVAAVVAQICVFDGQPRPSQMVGLRRGLDALQDHFEREKEKAA